MHEFQSKKLGVEWGTRPPSRKKRGTPSPGARPRPTTPLNHSATETDARCDKLSENTRTLREAGEGAVAGDAEDEAARHREQHAHVRDEVPAFGVGVDERLVDEERVVVAHERYTDRPQTTRPVRRIAPRGHSRSSAMSRTVRQSAYDFLFDFNRNCASIVYRFRQTAGYLPTVTDFNPPHLHMAPP